MRLISAGSAVRVRPPAPALEQQSAVTSRRFRVQSRSHSERLIDRVRRYAAQHPLWTAGRAWLRRVSGGSDSVALLFLLRELASRGELVLAGLAHLHHHIRGADADADAAFCRELAVAPRYRRARGRRRRAGAGRARRGVARSRGTRGAAAVLRRRRWPPAPRRSRRGRAHARRPGARPCCCAWRAAPASSRPGGHGAAPRPVVRPLLDVHARGAAAPPRGRCGETWREDATNLDRADPAQPDPPRRDAAAAADQSRKPMPRWRAPPTSCAPTPNFSRRLPTRRSSGSSKLDTEDGRA